MPGGSVSGIVETATAFYSREAEAAFELVANDRIIAEGNTFTDVMHTILAFAQRDIHYKLLFLLDNGLLSCMFTQGDRLCMSTLPVSTIDGSTQPVVSTIGEAIAFVCVDYGHPSRNDAPSAEILEQGSSKARILRTLREFCQSYNRCNLLLVLNNGLEVNIVPTLKGSVPALGEPGYADYVSAHNPNDETWDLSFSIWPALERTWGLSQIDTDEFEEVVTE